MVFKVTNAEEFDEVLKKIKIHISPVLFYPYNVPMLFNTNSFLYKTFKTI